MRKALLISEAAVFTVPVEKLSWPKTPHGRIFFILSSESANVGRSRFEEEYFHR